MSHFRGMKIMRTWACNSDPHDVYMLVILIPLGITTRRPTSFPAEITFGPANRFPSSILPIEQSFPIPFGPDYVLFLQVFLFRVLNCIRGRYFFRMAGLVMRYSVSARYFIGSFCLIKFHCPAGCRYKVGYSLVGVHFAFFAAYLIFIGWSNNLIEK